MPCYYNVTKTHSRTIRKLVSQPSSAVKGADMSELQSHHCMFEHIKWTSYTWQGRTQGGEGLGLTPPLEHDILQKLYHKGSVQGLIFYKNKGSACKRRCLLCQQTSTKRWFGNM